MTKDWKDQIDAGVHLASNPETQCRYCGSPVDSDGCINHVGRCLGLERVWLNQLQYDRLVQPDHTLVLRICTAYEQGFGQSGRALENPYTAGTREGEAWNMGWQVAKQRSVGETAAPLYTQSHVNQFIGYLSANIPELHSVSIPDLHAAWIEFLPLYQSPLKTGREEAVSLTHVGIASSVDEMYGVSKESPCPHPGWARAETSDGRTWCSDCAAFLEGT